MTQPKEEKEEKKISSLLQKNTIMSKGNRHNSTP
jgi:hypothetical protein